MIRVASWNIWQYMVPWTYNPLRAVDPGHRSGAEKPGTLETWLLRRAAIIAELQATKPDVIMLQECASNPEIAPDLPNQADQIATALGYRLFYRPFAKRDPDSSGELGLAILVRPDWPATVVMDLDLPWSDAHPKDVPRAALWCRVQTPEGLLDAVCTHLSLDPNARLRAVTILDRLLRVLSVKWRERGEEYPPLTLDDLLVPTGSDEQKPLGLILGGDFNAQPHELAIERLHRAWFRWPDEDSHQRAIERFANWPDPWLDIWAELEPYDPGFTFPTPEPHLRFDYLFLHPVTRLKPTAITMLGADAGAAGIYGSDHVGLLADLELTEE